MDPSSFRPFQNTAKNSRPRNRDVSFLKMNNKYKNIISSHAELVHLPIQSDHDNSSIYEDDYDNSYNDGIEYLSFKNTKMAYKSSRNNSKSNFSDGRSKKRIKNVKSTEKNAFSISENISNHEQNLNNNPNNNENDNFINVFNSDKFSDSTANQNKKNPIEDSWVNIKDAIKNITEYSDSNSNDNNHVEQCKQQISDIDTHESSPLYSASEEDNESEYNYSTDSSIYFESYHSVLHHSLSTIMKNINVHHNEKECTLNSPLEKNDNSHLPSRSNSNLHNSEKNLNYLKNKKIHKTEYKNSVNFRNETSNGKSNLNVNQDFISTYKKPMLFRSEGSISENQRFKNHINDIPCRHLLYCAQCASDFEDLPLSSDFTKKPDALPSCPTSKTDLLFSNNYYRQKFKKSRSLDHSFSDSLSDKKRSNYKKIKFNKDDDEDNQHKKLSSKKIYKLTSQSTTSEDKPKACYKDETKIPRDISFFTYAAGVILIVSLSFSAGFCFGKSMSKLPNDSTRSILFPRVNRISV